MQKDLRGEARELRDSCSCHHEAVLRAFVVVSYHDHEHGVSKHEHASERGDRWFDGLTMSGGIYIKLYFLAVHPEQRRRISAAC
ncbi:MAG TPA: hypothetical protein VGR30_15255 [Candidatus Binatia bacterium]|nr:hypothetical protein [Candidatus Binatia bacterium]